MLEVVNPADPSFDSRQSLASFIQVCRDRVTSCLKARLERCTDHPRLLEAMNYACTGGGKHIRSTLLYASSLAVEAEWSLADVPACAVELIHCYSLVHDDLPAMDDDDLRRGKPSLHKAFDEATAILVGDGLQSLAFEMLSSNDYKAEVSSKLQMLSTLATAIGNRGMVGGQFKDFSLTGKRASLPELESMHQMKTGALIRASVTMGALTLPDISERILRALNRYADKLGLAFQVQDDVLDVISDTATLGKPQGSDQAKDKPTYVELLGLKQAQRKAATLAAEAQESLAGFGASADRLRHLAAYIVKRTS